MPFFIFRQEFLLNLKNFSNLAQALIFFLITATIFAITTNIGADKISEEFAKQITVAILWICLTFAILLACNQHLQRDFNDGTLEQLYLSGYYFELVILTKILSNWLFNVLPLIIFLPVVALILRLPSQVTLELFLLSIIISLLINFLVSFGSSLTLGLGLNNGGDVLLVILILPLLIPIIIFANAGLSSLGGDFWWAVKLISALFIFFTPILTFASSAAVRFNLID